MIIKEINTDFEIETISLLAKEIWYEHFTPIIGENQVSYMLNKFLSEDVIKHSINFEQYTFFGLYEKEKLIGFSSIKKDHNLLFLSKLYIHKDCRKKGYSKQMLSYLEEYAMQFNLDGIWLTCNKYNYDTLEIYKHLGFKIFDEAVNDIGNNYVMDDYYLIKEVKKEY